MKMKVWNFYWRDNTAFTLFETVLIIVILGSLIANILGVFLFVNNLIYDSKIEDHNIGKINRSLEYMAYEIRKANIIETLEEQKDYVYFNNKYPDNIGILIRIKEADTNLFITYCLDGNKLRRMSFRTRNKKLNSLRKLEGYNLLSEDVYGLDESEYDKENMYININLKVNRKNKVERYNKFINLYGIR